MKHIIAKYSISLLMAVAMAAAAGCSHGISFDIEGELADKAASQVYLIVEKTTADTIATAAVGSDNRFRITGHADEPATAIICDDNGNTLTTLLLEKSPLRMRPDFEHGYVVEGGPVNDKYNIVARRLADITEEAYRLDPSDSLSRERFNSLANKYRDIVSTAVDDNIDNIIGVELFLYQESKGMSAGQMRSRFEQFPAKMRELTAMRRFADYIDIYERTEVGQKFIDLPLHIGRHHPCRCMQGQETRAARFLGHVVLSMHARDAIPAQGIHTLRASGARDMQHIARPLTREVA